MDRKPGPPLEHEDLVIIVVHFARRWEPLGWWLVFQVHAVIFRLAPGTHSTKSNEAGDFCAGLDSIHDIHP
jgi:hypothetical protein